MQRAQLSGLHLVQQLHSCTPIPNIIAASPTPSSDPFASKNGKKAMYGRDPLHTEAHLGVPPSRRSPSCRIVGDPEWEAVMIKMLDEPAGARSPCAVTAAAVSSGSRARRARAWWLQWRTVGEKDLCWWIGAHIRTLSHDAASCT